MCTLLWWCFSLAVADTNSAIRAPRCANYVYCFCFACACNMVGAFIYTKTSAAALTLLSAKSWKVGFLGTIKLAFLALERWSSGIPKSNCAARLGARRCVFVNAGASAIHDSDRFPRWWLTRIGTAHVYSHGERKMHVKPDGSERESCDLNPKQRLSHSDLAKATGQKQKTRALSKKVDGLRGEHFDWRVLFRLKRSNIKCASVEVVWEFFPADLRCLCGWSETRSGECRRWIHLHKLSWCFCGSSIMHIDHFVKCFLANMIGCFQEGGRILSSCVVFKFIPEIRKLLENLCNELVWKFTVDCCAVFS